MNNMPPGDQRKLSKYHDADSGFAWIVLIGPIANLLCKIYTFRCVAISGGFLVALGYFLSGFVPRMEFMYLTFMITGIGYGLSYAPCATIISYYFNKRRALANGIIGIIGGFGAIAFPFLYKYLIEQYSLMGAFLIIGGIFANVCAAACTFRQPGYLVEKQKEIVLSCTCRNTGNEYEVRDNRSACVRSDETIVSSTNKKCYGPLDLRISLFKNALFTLYVISFMCCAFGYTGSLILIPANIKALGYDKTYVALGVVIFGGVEVVARILIGFLADYTIIKRQHIYAVCKLIGGTFSLLGPFFNKFTFMAVYATVTAMFPGSYFSLISVMLIEIVGLENFAPAFGLLTFCLAFATLPSQPVVGWLYDLNGNWHASFILTGCVYILAGALMLLEPVVARVCARMDNTSTSSAENQQQGDHRGSSTNMGCEDDVG